MIIGTGIDIIEVDRIQIAVEKNVKFIEKIFTIKEIQYIVERNNNMQTIAGLFAAKEAISKALGYGIRDYGWQDIEIVHDEYGKPVVNLNRKAQVIAEKKGIDFIEISISHLKENAMAIAIANGEHILTVRESKKQDLVELEDAKWITKDFVGQILPDRELDAHKGNFGRIGVIAGKLGMTGSCYLSSLAALRSGSGLVYSIVPKSIANIIEIKSTETITKKTEDLNKGYFSIAGINDMKKAIDEVEVVVLGPGIGVDKERMQVVKEIMSYTRKPMILDADGINCLKDEPKLLADRDGVTIITPHPGELATLLGIHTSDIQADRLKYAKEVSKKFEVITVLKGSQTIVCDWEGQVYINTSGNPGMATAGSGDILSGVIASFVGQKINPLKAALAGVFVHGLAGDYAAFDKGEYGLIAGDILENLPLSISNTLKNKIQY